MVFLKKFERHSIRESVSSREKMYQAYTESTDHFVNWVVQTSKLKNLPHTLNALQIRIQDIVSDPANQPRKGNFLKDLKTALIHAEKAIEVRASVHMVQQPKVGTSSSRAGKDETTLNHEDHVAAIKILRECHSTLKDWSLNQREVLRAEKYNPKKKTVKSSSTNKSSDPFALQIDNEDNEDTTNVDLKNGNDLVLKDLDSQYGDIRLRLVCFFIEIASFEVKMGFAWGKVKGFGGSLVSATTVTHFALQRMKTVETELVALFPEYSKAENFFTALKTYLSPSEYEWMSTHDTFKMMNWVMQFYDQFVFRLEEANTQFQEMEELVRPRGSLLKGEVYNEFTRSPLRSEKDQIFGFLDTEVTLLMNSMIEARKKSGSYPAFLDKFQLSKDQTVTAPYFREFIQFFETRSQSLNLLFVTLSWIRSVQLLEDANFLLMSKNVYLHRSFIRTRNTNFIFNKKVFEQLKARVASNFPLVEQLEKLAALRESYRNDERSSEFPHSWSLQHHHPFLAGAQFLDDLYYDQSLCLQVMESYSQLHHCLPVLYTLFSQEGMVGHEIPYMDDYIYNFEELLFFTDGQSSSLSSSVFKSNSYKELCQQYLQACDNVEGKNVVAERHRWQSQFEETPLFTVKKLSVLFSALRDDDLSRLQNNKLNYLYSDEGFSELSDICDREFLHRGFLSVDVFQYFIRFNMFVLYLFEKSSIIRTWFEQTKHEYQEDYFKWTQQFFVPYLADYLKTPSPLRKKEDAHIIREFFHLMSAYFIERTAEKKFDKLFIIPENKEWKEIIKGTFKQACQYGLNGARDRQLQLRFNADPSHGKYYVDMISALYSSTLNSDFNEEMKCRLITTIKSLTADNFVTYANAECYGKLILKEENTNKMDDILSFFYLAFVDPKLKDIELAEFFWVTYGGYMYLRLMEAFQNYYPLFTVCRAGNAWGLDMLLSVSPLRVFQVLDLETNDSPLHDLAKRQRDGDEGAARLLWRVIKLGFVAHSSNGDGKPFTHYLEEDNEARKMIEKELEKHSLSVKHQCYDFSAVNGLTDNKSDQQQKRAPINPPAMQNDNKQKNNHHLGGEKIIKFEPTAKQRAAQAEKELIAMFEKEEEGTKKQKKTKKNKKK
jgi:hypothetical protein